MAEAKKTKKPVTEETQDTLAPTTDKKAQAAEARAKKEAAASKDVFIRVMKDGKGVEPSKKLPPQAQCIINTIEAAGADGIDRKTLVANLKGVLVTRQPEGRILSYYQKLIVEVGAVKITEGKSE